MPITTLSELRTLYPPPKAQAGLKVLDHLDVHCRAFIALSPFCVISSARADGRADASPRGDPPGLLAAVVDPKTLLLPDRPGNRQIDTMQNLVERPYVGLLFFVPGMTETLPDQRHGGHRHRCGRVSAIGGAWESTGVRPENHSGGGLPPLRQGRDPGSPVGCRQSNRPVELSHLRQGAGGSDRRRRRRRDRCRRNREWPGRTLLAARDHLCGRGGTGIRNRYFTEPQPVSADDTLGVMPDATRPTAPNLSLPGADAPGLRPTHTVQGRMPPFSHRASALSGSAISSTAPYQNASQPASGRPVNSIRLSG